mgnify:CR=1 FL=1
MNGPREYKANDVSIVVPCFNEEKRIVRSLRQLLNYVAADGVGARIIVVDDGSTDKTVELVSTLTRETEDDVIRLVVPGIHLGKGGALRIGIENSETPFVLFIDADLPTDLENIRIMLQKLREGYDAVFGTRLRSIRVEPIARRILSIGYHTIFSILFNSPYDSQCGIKAYRKNVALEVMEHVTVEDFAFDVDLVVQTRRRGYSIAEVPVRWFFRDWSKVRVLRQMLRMGTDLLKVWLKTKVKEPPIREAEKDFVRFYSSIDGDVRIRASRSLFLPRRIWYWKKDGSVVEAVEQALERFSQHEGDVLALDVGCGSGNIMQALAHRGLKVVGVDIGRGFVKYVNHTFGETVALLADARRLPFRPCLFHAIICSEVIEHLKGPREAILEMASVLANGGVLVLTTPRSTILWHLVEALWTKIRKEMLEVHHTIIPEGHLTYLLHKAGFVILKSKDIFPQMLKMVVCKKELAD